MPTYEYACKSCGQHVEAVQSFSDDPLTVCPHCGGALRKVFGNIGISFKGSGFYKNDSRSSTSSASPAAASAASSEGSASKDGSGSSPSKEASSPAKEGSAPAKATPAAASGSSGSGGSSAAAS